MVEGCCGWGRSGSMTLWFFLSLMLFVFWSGHIPGFSVLNTPMMATDGDSIGGGARHRVRNFVLLTVVFMATFWGSHYVCAHFIDEETDACQNLTRGHLAGYQIAMGGNRDDKIMWSFFHCNYSESQCCFWESEKCPAYGTLTLSRAKSLRRFTNLLISHSPVDLLFLPVPSNAMKLCSYSSSPDILWLSLVISSSFSRFQHSSNPILLLLN